MDLTTYLIAKAHGWKYGWKPNKKTFTTPTDLNPKSKKNKKTKALQKKGMKINQIDIREIERNLPHCQSRER